MFDVNADATGGFRGVEVLTRPACRRRWSAEDMARIIAANLAPEAWVSEITRRRQVCSGQVFDRDARARRPREEIG